MVFFKEQYKKGTIVVVKEHNMPISTWLLGKIEELIYDKDKKVKICTKKGLFKQPITKLTVLSIDNT